MSSSIRFLLLRNKAYGIADIVKYCHSIPPEFLMVDKEPRRWRGRRRQTATTPARVLT